MRRKDFPDLDSLARRLSENGALSDAVARDVAALLSRCDALVKSGTEMRTEWMPKSVCGDDVTEYEAWIRSERTPEAAALLPVTEDLRHFLGNYPPPCAAMKCLNP